MTSNICARGGSIHWRVVVGLLLLQSLCVCVLDKGQPDLHFGYWSDMICVEKKFGLTPSNHQLPDADCLLTISPASTVDFNIRFKT